MKKCFASICALLIALCLLIPSFSVQAAAQADPLTDITGLSGMPEAPDIEAPSAILIEAKTGSILYAKNAEEQLFPASITKIMTALLTIENCSLDETVTFSYRATHELEENSSGIARTEGEEMSVRDCLYALLIASANEVAQALAEHISGSFESFAELMNQRAAELGCTNTHFSNPSGLNDPEHYTSARDMALIMREAVDNPTFLKIASTPRYTIPATNQHSEPLQITMKHLMLLNGADHYEYAVAGKTGYTSLAGYTLVTYAVKGDMELICVILNASTAESRYACTRSLFEYGFNQFQMISLDQTGSAQGTTSGSSHYLGSSLLSLTTAEDAWLLLPSSLSPFALETQVTWGDTASGEALASVTYSYQGTPVGRATLMVQNDPYNQFPYNGAAYGQQGRGNISIWTVAACGAAAVLLLVLGILLFRLVRRKPNRLTFQSGSRWRKSRRRRY